MPLRVLDGNQTATTLSSVVTGGEHIVAHTVVSLGSTAISNITSAVSGSVVSISNYPATQTIAGTVTANLADVVANDLYNENSSVRIMGSGNNGVILQGIDVGLGSSNIFEGGGVPVIPREVCPNFPISGTVTVSSLPASTVTVSSLPVISGTVTVGSLPAISGSVTASVSNSITIGNVVTISNVQGTSVTTSNFTSTTASTTIASQNNSRRGLTIFNEGAGNLHICAGSTSTTISYQVRMLAGDYWECPLWQTSLTHSAQFASAGTARVTEIT